MNAVLLRVPRIASLRTNGFQKRSSARSAALLPLRGGGRLGWGQLVIQAQTTKTVRAERASRTRSKHRHPFVLSVAQRHSRSMNAVLLRVPRIASLRTNGFQKRSTARSAALLPLRGGGRMGAAKTTGHRQR